MKQGFVFTASCLQCGAPISLVNQAVQSPQEVVGVAECAACNRQYVLHVRLVPEARPGSLRRARDRAKAGAA